MAITSRKLDHWFFTPSEPRSYQGDTNVMNKQEVNIKLSAPHERVKPNCGQTVLCMWYYITTYNGTKIEDNRTRPYRETQFQVFTFPTYKITSRVLDVISA